jgi:uncharacterized membrane protein
MLTWNVFALSYLLFSWITIVTSHPRQVMVLAKVEDTSRFLIFLFVVAASFISLFAIIFLLQNTPHISKRGLSLDILLSFLSVLCSWTLIHTLFTLRYAHLYYSRKYHSNIKGEETFDSGLDFPNRKEPDYLDFAYFSFVIGMTFQVSDVQITSTRIRRLVLVHGLLSFIYNTIIVALSINIVAAVIQR